MPKRIIVGPTSMYVERYGRRSEERSLTENDCPKTVRQIASEQWEEIRSIVFWAAWNLHRLKMARTRRLASHVQHTWPGPYHRGPRPDLIATKHWKQAKYGEWRSLPHGVVSMLLRLQPGEERQNACFL